MTKSILIAGGTGMVGQALVGQLLLSGHKVSILSTRKGAAVDGAHVFYWQPQQFEMDETALQGVDAVINLAGATVSKRWTPHYKQDIFDSRTRTAETIFRALSKQANHTVSIYISASGVNYYPASLRQIYKEDDKPTNDFLGQVCQHWEAGADKFKAVNVRVLTLRIGVVLSRSGGAVKKLEPLARLGINSPVGSGNQWMSWIHIDDLVNLIKHGIDNNLEGVYNAVAPGVVTNKAFTKALGKALKRPVFMPNIPAAVLKLALGEMSTIVLEGVNCASSKIEETGFSFTHKTIDEAFTALYLT